MGNDTHAGRVALVTGASRGLGREIARWLAANGSKLVVCARSRDGIDDLAGELRGVGTEVIAEQCDVADANQVGAFVAHAIDSFGTIDIAVANAAILGPVGPIVATDADEWARVVQVNVAGTAAVARAVIPTMEAQGWGRIITLSGAGVGGPNIPSRVSAYVASKAAVMLFTEALAKELAQGVTINAVAPGPVPTAFTSEILDVGPEVAGAELFESVRDMEMPDLQPLRELVLYIASDESKWLNGRSLSARWDPPSTLRTLANGDIDEDRFHLRRIDEDLYTSCPRNVS